MEGPCSDLQGPAGGGGTCKGPPASGGQGLEELKRGWGKGPRVVRDRLRGRRHQQDLGFSHRLGAPEGARWVVRSGCALLCPPLPRGEGGTGDRPTSSVTPPCSLCAAGQTFEAASVHAVNWAGLKSETASHDSGLLGAGGRGDSRAPTHCFSLGLHWRRPCIRSGFGGDPIRHGVLLGEAEATRAGAGGESGEKGFPPLLPHPDRTAVWEPVFALRSASRKR